MPGLRWDSRSYLPGSLPFFRPDQIVAFTTEQEVLKTCIRSGTKKRVDSMDRQKIQEVLAQTLAPDPVRCRFA